MNNRDNLIIYRLYAPLYDRLMRFWTATARRKALALLELKPGEQLLIPGVGTGLDLPGIPAGVRTVAVDLSPAMLHQARGKRQVPVSFGVMDGQRMAFPDDCFDAVLLNLIRSVAPDGKQALEEACRVLRPGGRVVVFDKFLPEQAQSSAFRKLIGSLIRKLGTDPNRRFRDMVRDLPGLTIQKDEPVLLRGQYRLILLTKPLH